MYRLSFFGAIHLAQGRLVWNDALGRKQFPLTLAHFRAIVASAYPLQRITEHASSDDESTINDLLQKNVLVAPNSDRALLEEELMSKWQAWGTYTRLYHFSSRTVIGSPFLNEQSDSERLRMKFELFPPPKRWSMSDMYAQRETVALPNPVTISKDYIDVLRTRRSPVKVVGSAVSLENVSTILRMCAGLDDRNNEVDARSGNYFRYAPSGGARASVEVFLCARNVKELREGCYWYLADTHKLRRIGAFPDSATLEISLNRQIRFTEAPLFFVIAGNLQAVMWKYQTGRAYRDLFWDAGHVGQILQMTASALGLDSVFTIVQDDEVWENILGISPADMPILGVYAVGHGCGRKEVNIV